MPSTYSPNLRLELIGSGEQAGTWGTTTNTNLGTLVEQAISGRALIVMANADYTLTTATGATDEARNMYLDITSSVNLTATRTVTCPAVPKMYVVRNATLNNQSIIISAGGIGYTIANGDTVTVVCDGTNIRPIISDIVTLNGGQTLTNKTLTTPVVSGGTFSGDPTFSGNPTISGFPTFSYAAAPGFFGYINLGGRGIRKVTADNRIEVINNANTAVTHEFFDDGGFSVTGAAINIGVGTAGEKQLYLHNSARQTYFYLNMGGTVGLWDATSSSSRWTSDTSGNFAVAGNLSANNLVSGFYSPSVLFTTADVTAISIPISSQYIRVGGHVMVTGRATVSNSVPGTFAVVLSLPIASTFSTDADVSGSAALINGVVGQVYRTSAISGLALQFSPPGAVTNAVITWSAMYVIR